MSHDPLRPVNATRRSADPVVAAARTLVLERGSFRFPADRFDRAEWTTRGVSAGTLKKAVAELVAKGAVEVVARGGEVWVQVVRGGT